MDNNYYHFNITNLMDIDWYYENAIYLMQSLFSISSYTN